MIAKRDFFNFYGALEAGEYLWEGRQQEIIEKLAEGYLELAGLLMASQFQYMVRNTKNSLDILKNSVSVSSYESIRKHRDDWRKWKPGQKCIAGIKVPLVEVFQVYDYLLEEFGKENDSVDELIICAARAWNRLKEACSNKDINKISRAIDYINYICHSEAQLITWIDEEDEEDTQWAAYALTLVSASVYQPESLVYMDRDIRVALRLKARILRAGGTDLYNREQFINNFVRRLELLKLCTAEFVLEQIDSTTLIQEIKPKLYRSNRDLY